MSIRAVNNSPGTHLILVNTVWTVNGRKIFFLVDIDYLISTTHLILANTYSADRQWEIDILSAKRTSICQNRIIYTKKVFQHVIRHCMKDKKVHT